MRNSDEIVVKFNGINPMTGLPITIIFNEPAPNRKNVMNWNPLLNSWMFSCDAGLHWHPVKYIDYIEKTDCLLS